MSSDVSLKNEQLFSKIRVISNRFRFKILELTQKEELSISELSRTLKLAYTKCADYASMLEKQGLVEKRKDGKEVFVRSKARIEKDSIILIG